MKKFLYLVLILVLVLGTAAFYFYKKATRLPSWYEPGSEGTMAESLPQEIRSEPPGRGPRPDRGPAASALSSQASPPPPAPAPGETRLDDDGMTALLLRSLDAHPRGRRARAATKAIRATVEGERLKLGAVTDVDRLLAAAESNEEKAAIQKLKGLFPWIAGRDFYVGLDGRPTARDGRLVFESFEVEIGDVSFDALDLAEKLGVDHLPEGGVAVPLTGLDLQDVRIENGQVHLDLGSSR